MAGLVLFPVFVGLPLITSNVGSLVEGKGLRIGGALLDTAIFLGSTAATMTLSENHTIAEKVDEFTNSIKSDINTRDLDFAIGSVSIIGMYVGTKYLIGSPTSVLNNTAVATANMAVLYYIMSNLKTH